MTESTTFYWYDFETFGLDCRRDRPAQFAGIRTDMDLRKLFKSTLNNRLHRNLACVIDKSSRGAKLERAFEELPLIRREMGTCFIPGLRETICPAPRAVF